MSMTTFHCQKKKIPRRTHPSGGSISCSSLFRFTESKDDIDKSVNIMDYRTRLFPVRMLANLILIDKIKHLESIKYELEK